MGNKNSTTGGIEPATLSNFTNRSDETEGILTRSTNVTSPHRTSPPFPKRSYTVVERPHKGESHAAIPPLVRAESASSLRQSTNNNAAHQQTSKNDLNQLTSDDLSHHIVEFTPKEGSQDVPLGTNITVLFDKDVRTVNINKLFEVTCDSPNPLSNPVKGHVSYDARQMKAEFIPHKTLFPNSRLTVKLLGKAITTNNCSYSSNIKDATFSFHTHNPPPKTVRIKLKDQSNTEQLQIANFYDPLNSLINWSSRKWGCSGEHVVGLYAEREDGKLTPLKVDIDVLEIKEDETIVVEIKD